jgi:trigger factor
MNMQVSVEASTGLERRMRVQIPAEQVDKEVSSRLTSLGKNAKIQGFRPGKVPAKVIRQRYGGQVRQEVLQEMLQSSYSEAVMQEKLQPAGGPTIEPGDLTEGQDLTYTAVFEVYPEVELKGLDKIKVTEPVAEVAEGDIDTMVDNLRKQRADWKAVSRKAADGDQVTIDFTGTLKGEVFEGGSAENFNVVLGDGAMLPDFEKNLQGVAAGDGKSFKLKFPKDYQTAELAGQKVEFSIKVHEVAEQELPEIDEEFVKTYGIDSGDVQDLRKDIAANMEREILAKSKADGKRQLLEGLLAGNPIELPEVLITQECAAMSQEAMQRMGITEPEQAPPAETFREAAVKRVRLGLLMSAAISENDIALDQARVTSKVDEICEPYENPDEIRQIYMQNQQFLSQIQNMVLEEQVVEWLLEQAQTSSRKMAFKELMELSG